MPVLGPDQCALIAREGISGIVVLGLASVARSGRPATIGRVSIIARKSGPERAREVRQFHAKSGQFHAMRVLARGTSEDFPIGLNLLQNVQLRSVLRGALDR
jgi:hypothetical protein